ncbi:MAG: YceH family protein [Lysobacterales bacterium]
MEETCPALAQLSAIEARVLGCLIEKQKTTPEQYPLSLNALTLACNQKTSREPVMDLSPGEVGHCLRELQARELVERAFGGRVERYEHRFDRAYGLTLRKQALLALLMLRGAQTVNELLTRAERLADFSDAEDLRHTLERMAEQSPALVVNLGRGAGQREDRFMHLLSGTPDPATVFHSEAAPRAASGSALEARVAALEAAVAELSQALAQLHGKSSPDEAQRNPG